MLQRWCDFEPLRRCVRNRNRLAYHPTINTCTCNVYTCTVHSSSTCGTGRVVHFHVSFSECLDQHTAANGRVRGAQREATHPATPARPSARHVRRRLPLLFRVPRCRVSAITVCIRTYGSKKCVSSSSMYIHTAVHSPSMLLSVRFRLDAEVCNDIYAAVVHAQLYF